MNDIPKFEITLDPEYSENGEKLGIEKIAHTKRPAIKVKGMAFSDQEIVMFSKNKHLSFNDDLKYRIAAPLMIPGDIFRDDEEDGKHFVEFTEEVIVDIHKDLMKNLKNDKMYNEEHDNKKISDKSYLLEVLLVDSESKIKMIKEDYNLDIPKGSLFTITQIEDKDYYNYLVENDMLGLSLEGYLGTKLKEQKNKNQNMNDKTKLKKLEEEKKSLLQKYSEIEEKIKKEIEEDETKLESDKKEDEEIKASTDEPKKDDETKLESDKKEDEEIKASTDEPKKDDETKLEETPAVPSEEGEVIVNEEEILKVIQPKLDEIIEMIAELKASLIPPTEDEENGEKEQFKFSENENRISKMLRLHSILQP